MTPPADDRTAYTLALVRHRCPEIDLSDLLSAKKWRSPEVGPRAALTPRPAARGERGRQKRSHFWRLTEGRRHDKG